ncbi:MAG: carbonic anhydrase [Dehalococcoidia bacterium]
MRRPAHAMVAERRGRDGSTYEGRRQPAYFPWRCSISLLDDILESNARFVTDRKRSIGRHPAKKIALFTCMDTRLVEFLEPAMGLGRGDAIVIKNAGTTVTDSDGSVIRSLVVAIHALGCEEVCVIGHLDCGMGQIDEGELQRRMLERGVPASAVESLHPGVKGWLGAFQDVYNNVRSSAGTIRQSPFIPADVPVHGLVFDPVSGRLELLVSS